MNLCKFLFSLVFAIFLFGPPARAQMSAMQPDLAKLSDEALVWLADLVRINTTNPPGNETVAARYIAAVLSKEGIANEVIEIEPGRGIVIGRLQKGPLPDPSTALLLLGHLDVVGVDPKKWTVDPFAAIQKDGYLWGRGAIDDKGMVAANLAAIVALKRSGVRLSRDLIFLADADEEQFGSASIKKVIEKHWDKIACAWAINEGGLITMKDGKVLHVDVQASEKIPHNVTVIATGTSGHASIPLADNPVAHLAAAIAKISVFQTPVQPNTIARRYFEQLSKVEDPDTARWMRAIEQPERLNLAAKNLGEKNPLWNAMLRDSIAPTILQAGVRVNVIPSEARVNLNIRLLPGHSIHSLLAELKKLVDDPQIRFEIEPDSGENAPPSDIDSELFKTIESVTQREFPGAVAVPFLSTGATDSAQLRLRRVQALGLRPFPLTDQDGLRIHGDDERIPIESFRKGVAFLYRVVNEFVAAK